MKKQFIFMFLLGGLLFASCGGDASSSAVEAGDAKDAAKTSVEALSFQVDPAASVIKWEGYKPGQYGHNGTIKVQGGKISVKDGAIEGGKFVIDMTSLENTDLADSPEKKAKLEGHLKSGDFFEVEKFPTATFEVVEVKADANGNATVVGNLTLKNITKSVEIPAQVKMADGAVYVQTPEFTINRTDWDVKFKSGLLGTVKDQIIADDVKLSIKLVGKS